MIKGKQVYSKDLEAKPLGIKSSELLMSEKKPCLIYMATGNGGEKIETEMFAGNWTSKLRKMNRVIIVNPDSFGSDILRFYTLYNPDEKLFSESVGAESRAFHDSDKTKQFSYTVEGEPEEVFDVIIEEVEEAGYAFEGR